MGFFFIELLILVVLGLILWNRAKAGLGTLFISFGAKKRRAEDISDRENPMPPELKFSVAKLTELKFRRLGEVQVAIPGGRAVKSRIFLSKDKTVFADLAETQQGLVVFFSLFPDDAVVETGFPIGENINTSAFRSHTIVSNMENAYQHQLAQVKAFKEKHGKPRKIKKMEDYLAWDAMYRKRHVARKMRRHTWLSLWQIVALIYGILATIAAAVYWLGTDKSTIDPLIIITFFLVAALAPAAILSFFLPYIGDWGNRRESK